MMETVELNLKRISFVNCCSLIWLGLILIINMGFTEVSTHSIIGEVKPAEVQIQIGADANITCRMNISYFNENNSSCLSFYREHSHIPVPKEEMHVVNESSIIMILRNTTQEQSDNYICKCFDKKVSSTNVVVGTKITDFQCRGYDYEYMICKFTIPESKIETDYHLTFGYPIWSDAIETDICTTQKLDNGLFERVCNITGNLYRQVSPYYEFTVTANNLRGSFTQALRIYHHESIIPAKPLVTIGNLTSNSVTLYWNVLKFSQFSQTNGLQYEIKLHPENFDWYKVNKNSEIQTNRGHYEAKIYNLQYPYRRYNFSVKARVANISTDTMWSEPFQGTFFTQSRRPDRPPNVGFGSFFFDSTNKNIRLYWETLAEYERNGPDFKYNFTVVRCDGKLIKHLPVHMDEFSALFTYENTSICTFKLNSQNINGSSLNSSVYEVHLPEKLSKQEIIKMYNQRNNSYKIVWKESEDFESLNNFTLFTCEAKTELETDCMGSVYYKTLNKNTLNFTIFAKPNKKLNIALSKNYKNYSTGMLWATCVTDNEPKTKNIILDNPTILESSIYFKWITECWYSVVFKDYQYNLTYCMVSSKDKNECVSKSETKLIPIIKNSFLIEDLKPSSIYKIWIRMFCDGSKGPLSEDFIETLPDTKNTKCVIIIALSIFLSIFTICASIKMYLNMKNIKLIFPDGLFEINKPQNNNFNIMKQKYPNGNRIHFSSNAAETFLKKTASKKETTSVQMVSSNVSIKQLWNNKSCLEAHGKNLNENFSSVTENTAKLTTNSVLKNKIMLDIKESLKVLWFFVTTMCLITSPVSANDYVGEVIPHDVELPIGGSVNITCRMNRSYFNDHNSSCLAFFRDDGNLKVPKEHIHVVDDSSIIFMIRNATEQRAQYSCKCHDKGVYITNIFVGTPPTNVSDFQCLGYDFSFMTCNFTVPQNKIYTDYKLKFSSSSPDYIYTCNLENGLQPSERICNITMDNNNYRIVYQYYNFELTASNSLGTLTQSIMIDQYNRIVPARPLVEVGNLTTNSVTLYWMVNKFSQYTHTDGLQYEIRLRPEKFDWFYINTNTVLQKNKEHYKAEINNLQYPYRRYEFIVRVKTVRANNSDETMWSEPFEGVFYTKPRRPERAPDMDVGSFYIDPTEQNIRIYWQQLAEYEENGPDFLYNITEVQRDGKLINVQPFQRDSTSATYEWKRTSYYQFKLQSQNQVGKSLNTSILEVHPTPKRSQQIEQIQVITKVYHNQTYTITWRQPSDMDSLKNFTLFWCISKMESQSQCKGTINFKHFDKLTTNHTTEPQNHTLNFAVSANYETYSTGMMWAMCTADGATDLTKMDPETSPISSNSIKIQWSTECLYMAILEGYNLTYCKVENHVPEIIGDCINTEKTISISKLAKEYIITDLDPFTTYKISILMYSKLKIGPMSNPVMETTTEDAPSPPRKLKKYNVTSDSVTLSWLPPKYSNGNLRYYTVWYKNEGTIVNSTSNDNGSEITFQLGDLSSYSDYKVYVTAHTVKSSGPSNDIHFKTLIGIPSPPLSFNMNRNDKELVFHWSPPKLPSGRVEFYEVRVTVHKNNESETLKKSRVVGHYCKMNIPCYDPNNSYIFDVRAVNLAEKNEVDYHTFSKRDTSYLSILHQGGAKKRRHSNAEINASIGTLYQIHETDKNSRHRHERENLNLIQTTEPPFITEDESDEDFICIGGEKETLKILRQYKDSSQYKLFYSPWQNGPIFSCSETKFSKLTMLALVVIVVTMALLAAVYYARKKYNKMSNISLVIPEGLDDNINVSKGVDNKIERDEIIRSDELFYEKENHRLLSKVGNDSGFLNSVHCLDKSSAYVCSDLQDSEKSSQSTDSVELNDITSCSYTSSPSHSPNANIREMSIPEERSNPPILQPSVQLRPSENGYIKPIMMSNGYVQPHAFQKLQPKETPSFNGYTSLDAMGKPVFPQASSTSSAPIAAESNSYEVAVPKNVNNKDIAIPHPVSGNICGYVTHKQLSDFGRLQ
ncbi:uncharacterized protein LOC129940176 isoform X2 [Eupeodes corollae]|uniref:uncharacterized protein LOC129940176 isoform X2 n=1 Tax=Eupeodes corollae TaxID=290404 RepID=UPI00249146ED|nr:uncharacterized protein LOC129940176 isoform X2 [Eupeodes corollae]